MKSKFNIGCSEVLEAAPILTLILKVMTSLALFALTLEESRWFLAGRVQQPALEERSQSQAGLGAAVAVSAQAQLRAGQGRERESWTPGAAGLLVHVLQQQEKVTCGQIWTATSVFCFQLQALFQDLSLDWIGGRCGVKLGKILRLNANEAVKQARRRLKCQNWREERCADS